MKHKSKKKTKQKRSSVSAQNLLLLVILLSALLSMLSLASPQVSAISITNINVPSTIHEGEELELRFTTDEPANNTISEDGTILASGSGNNLTYTKTLDYDSAGLHTYTFTALGGNSSISENRTVEVIDTPLSFVIEEPQESDYSTTDISVSLETNIDADVCYTVTESGTHTLTKNGLHHAGSISLPDGIHTVTIKCDRNGEIAVQTVTLKIDTTPPSISLSPSGTVNKPILKAVTNEVSDCRYGTNLQTYDQLPNAFPETASLTHEALLDLEEGSYTYSVACRDVYGNRAPPVTTSFTVARAPTATISVEGENPHKAGTYRVALESSEPLAAVPELTLSYQGGSSQKLSLTKEASTRYTGLVIVPEDAGELVGSFSWKGVDLDGTTGTSIDDGSLFVVDTVKPGKIKTFKAVNGSTGVNLSWYYDGPETLFNIYRSTTSGVDYTDFYTTSAGDEYVDYDTEDAVNYYYRIAAVDEAGNVGPLSNEEWASKAAAVYDSTKAGAILNPVLQVDLNRRLKTLESTILDAEQAVRMLKSASEKDKSRVITLLSLNERAAKALAELRNAKSAYEDLRTLSLTDKDYEMRVTSIQHIIDSAKQTLPLDVKVDDEISYDETPDEDVLSAASSRVLSGRVLSEAERATYDEKMALLNDAVRVMVTATHAVLSLADGRDQKYTVVEKHLISQTPQNNVLAIETIPKSFAQRADIIEFLDDEPLVLEQDPVLQYSYSSLTDQQFSYAVKGTVPFPTVRQARLALLPKPTSTGGVGASVPAEPGGQLTGGVTSFIGAVTGGQGLLLLFGIIIIAGLLLYYFTMDGSDLAPAGTANTGKLSDEMRGTPAGLVSPSTVNSALRGGENTFAMWAPALLQQSPTILVERSKEPLVGLLRRGHELADDARYLDALYFYKRALERYDVEQFPGERIKRAVQEELAQLYQKLSLFSTMMRAHDAAYAGNSEELAALLDEMRAHAESLEDRTTTLAEKAASEYAYLYRALNRLKMDLKEQPL